MADHAATMQPESAERLERRLARGPAILYTFEIDDSAPALSWISGNVEDILGHGVETCLGDSQWWRQHIHPGDRDEAVARVAELSSAGRLVQEYRFRHGDGGYRWMHDDLNVFANGPGAPLRAVGAWTDVSGRKEIGNAVQSANDRLNFLLSAGPGAIYTCKPWGNFETTFISESVTPLLGYRPEQFVADPGFWIDHIHPDDRDGVWAGLRHLFEGDRHAHEYRFRLASGAYRWMRGEPRLVRDAAGEPSAIVGAWSDIDEDKRAEDTLGDSEARFRELFEAAPVSIWEEDWSGVKDMVEGLRGRGVRDWDGYFRRRRDKLAEAASLIRMLRVNQASLDIYRATNMVSLAATFHGGNMSEVELDVFHGLIVAFANGEFDVAGDHPERTMTGDEIITRVRTSIPPLHRDRWSRVLSVVEDVTERVRAREALARANQELRESHDELEARVEARTADLRAVNRRLRGEVAERERAERELAEKSALLEGLVEHAPAIVMIRDLDGRYLLVNPEYERQMGRSREDVLGKSPRDLLPRDVAELYLEQDRRVIETGKPDMVETPALHVDGTMHTYLNSKFPVRDADGRLTAVGVMATDITERKRAEEALRESERSLANAQWLARIGNWDHDLDTGSMHWSDQLYRILGVRPDEIEASAEAYIDLIHPADKARIEKLGATLYATHEPYSADYRIIRPDGLPRHIHTEANVSIDQSSQAVRVSGTDQDITERKLTEEALRGSEARLKAIVDHYPSAVFLKDTAGRYVLINESYEDLFGITLEDVKGKTMDDFFPRDVAGPATDVLRRVVETGATITIEERLHYRGAPRSCLLVMFAVRDADGAVVGVAGIGADITERKALEDMLAYEFNTLLNAITSYVDAANRDGAADGGLDWLADRAGRSGWRGTEVIKRLLAHGFNEEEHPEPIGLNHIIGEIDDVLEGTLGELIEINRDLSDGLWQAEADPRQVKYILINLALSASDAMPHGGELTIETANARIDDGFVAQYPQARSGEFVMLAVADTGNRVAPAPSERVYNPVLATDEKSNAAGVGLSALNGFAERSNGFVTMENGAGRGTRVALYLPRAEPAVTPG